jgi:hypothetical protein
MNDPAISAPVACAPRPRAASEAFLFNDAVAGMRGDADRLREVEAAILGVTESAGGRPLS